MNSAQLQIVFHDPTSNLENLFRDAHRRLKPRMPVPPIRAEFFPFAGLNHTARLNDGKLRIRVSDIFMDAPSEVLGSLATILLAKLYRKSVDDALHRIYRVYILKPDIQERARAARSERGRTPPHTSALGRYVDLDASYERINRLYFDEGMKRPQLSWSTKRSRYTLARYDALHHTIFVSRVFDSPDVPDYVIDYIMFHEMLHVKHRSRVQDARCLVHTSEFREDERRFAHYKPAKQWLKSL